MAILSRRHKPNLRGRSDRSLRQTIRQTRHSVDVCDLAARREHCSKHYRSRNLIFTSRLCVSRLGLFQDSRLRSDILATKDLTVIAAAATAAGAAATFATRAASSVATFTWTITATATWSDAAALAIAYAVARTRSRRRRG